MRISISKGRWLIQLTGEARVICTISAKAVREGPLGVFSLFRIPASEKGDVTVDERERDVGERK